MSYVEEGSTAAGGRLRRRAVMRAVGGNGSKGTQNPAPTWAPPEVRAPIFPKRRYDIRDFGASPGANETCTASIARAISACADAGGGRVVIPSGEWLTGPIHLKSNVELHLSAGAVVRFSAEAAQYLPPVFVRWGGQECFNYSPLIYAQDCENIAITGKGVLLGQGMAWWRWHEAEQQSAARLYQMVLEGVPIAERRFGSPDRPLRPQLFLAINCRNILLEDFAIDEAGPLWSIHLAYCRNIAIKGLRINTPAGANANAIVIDSSRDVLIEDCTLHANDDCISLKSGLNEDGLRVGKPTENVLIRRVRCTGGHGGICIGSEMSGGVRRVFVHDCELDGIQVGIRIKAARGRGGVVEDLLVQDVTLGRIDGDAIELTTEYATFVSPGGPPPTFRNIRIRNVTCRQAKTAARMIGLADSALQNITLENVTITADEGLLCSAGNGVNLVNVKISPRTGPVMCVKDSREVLIHGLNIGDCGGVFLDLRGRRTRNIRLVGEAGSGVRPAIVLGMDVPRDSVLHE